MWGKRLSESMNAIGDDLIADAMEYKAERNRNVWLRVAAAAAAVVLAVAAYWVVGREEHDDGPVLQVPSATVTVPTTGLDLWPTAPVYDESVVFPPVRFGKSGMSASFTRSYTFEEAFSEADVVARVRVGNWLREDTEIESTYYEAKVLQCFKGTISPIFTLKQDGCSLYTFKGYPLFTYGNEFLVFLKKATGDSCETTYWIIGSYTTIFDVSYDRNGKRYYVDQYGILGSRTNIDMNYTSNEVVNSEIWEYAKKLDPIVENWPIYAIYIFSEEDILLLIEQLSMG